MPNADHNAALEALLFAYGEPMAVKKIAAFLRISAEEASAAVAALKEKLKDGKSGLALMVHDGSVQLATRPEFGDMIAALLKAESQEELTPASQETLAIIAYAGPIARADIDFVRGVNSSFILRSLLMRGLIDRAPDQRRGNAYSYTPSMECLRHLGVTAVSDLPDYQKYRALAEKMAAANALPAEALRAGEASPAKSDPAAQA